ncbi:MAG TPA: ZIP family metal transporter [Chitinophagales bacterium]|nr:ZIP family metal transporter [Chitinophagales bacterium]
MQTIIDFFAQLNPILAAFIATTFTWFLTAVGAGFVFFFKTLHRKVLDTMLGFTGGVMLAASFWSLLQPSIEMSETLYPSMPWMPAAVGFLIGGLLIFSLDKWLPHLHINFKQEEKEGVPTNWHSTTLLVLAITLHNIPEGLAVGVLFGAASLGMDNATTTGAVALALGIGLQNLPEGTAISVPLRRQGLSRLKSFWYGQLSAIVEPVAGILGAALVIYVQPVLPFALAFAAGAMVYVVIEEVIPETQRDKYTDAAALGFIGGFLIMMILDVGLG